VVEYRNFCWSCKLPVDSVSNSRCPECGWLICSCGHCKKDCPTGDLRVQMKIKEKDEKWKHRFDELHNEINNQMIDALKPYHSQTSEYFVADILCLLVGYAISNIEIGSSVAEKLFSESDELEDIVKRITDGEIDAFSEWIHTYNIKAEEAIFEKYYRKIKNERLTVETYHDFLTEIKARSGDDYGVVGIVLLKDYNNMERVYGKGAKAVFELDFTDYWCLLWIISEIRNEVINCELDYWKRGFYSTKTKDYFSKCILTMGDRYTNWGTPVFMKEYFVEGIFNREFEKIEYEKCFENRESVWNSHILIHDPLFSQHALEWDFKQGLLWPKWNLPYMIDTASAFWRIVKLKKLGKFIRKGIRDEEETTWIGEWKYSLYSRPRY